MINRVEHLFICSQAFWMFTFWKLLQIVLSFSIVFCLFLTTVLIYIYCCLVAQSCQTLCKPTRLFAHGISQAKNTEVGCHFLLQLTHTQTHTHTYRTTVFSLEKHITNMFSTLHLAFSFTKWHLLRKWT